MELAATSRTSNTIQRAVIILIALVGAIHNELPPRMTGGRNGHHGPNAAAHAGTIQAMSSLRCLARGRSLANAKPREGSTNEFHSPSNAFPCGRSRGQFPLK